MVEIATILLQNYGAVALIIGILVCALWFFIRRTVRREDRLQKQIDDLNKEFREAVVPVLVQCKDAIKQNSMVLMRLIDGGGE